MNAWGVIVLALGGVVLYWSVKHGGTLAELGTDIGLGYLAASTAGKLAPSGSGADDSSSGEGAEGEAGEIAEVP